MMRTLQQQQQQHSPGSQPLRYRTPALAAMVAAVVAAMDLPG
jgi:hypothetical protein